MTERLTLTTTFAIHFSRPLNRWLPKMKLCQESRGSNTFLTFGSATKKSQMLQGLVSSTLTQVRQISQCVSGHGKTSAKIA